jgi:hypothetical protein
MKGLNEENKKRLLKAIQEVAAVKQSLYLRQIK